MEKTAKKLPSSVQSVISNNDLLIQILVRLPPLSLILFKSVSKRWLSLIKDDVNVTFRRNPDPPSGLFLERMSLTNTSESYSCDFVPLDNRIPLLGPNFTFGPEVRHKHDVEILHSCNGLLLCRTYSKLYNHIYYEKLYVYNPSITNMFKVLPIPNIETYYKKYGCGGGVKMAFDPSKSPHYKVIYAEIVERDMDDMDDMMVQLHTFSSETGNWSLCGHQFPEHSFQYFEGGVYWNDAIYWPIGEGKIFKLEIVNEYPVLTALRTPLTLDLKVHYINNLFESRGCLLLFCMDNACSQHFTIYEKRNVYSEWSLKYIVNLDDIIKPFPKRRWSECPYVFCIVLGEREEDSFMVMKLDKKVVQYKIVSKTLCTISDLGDGLITGFEFIPSFANV
ncbi:AT-hook motif nuclear-localized protein 28-like protein [Tanacetum coccineum]|uniref:AT-hook motif nuclear-localized protein 28-like protein n=1 Tax=Tanacetum coccineum TaxID=301880 RepID=A0ABQ5BVA6_9ASTR